MGCCAGALILSGAPRVALFFIWIFDDERLSRAFDSFILGFLGFLLLPYTTVFYALAYAPVEGVSGFGWFLVVLGFVIDISSYTSSEYSRRKRYA